MKNLITKELHKSGFEYVVCVPCSMLKEEIKYSEKNMIYIPAVDELTAIGIVNGLTVGGKKAILMTQNSAVGRMSDILASFNIPYKVKIPWILSMRGYEGDTEVHKLGNLMSKVLAITLGVPFVGTKECDCSVSELIIKTVLPYLQNKSVIIAMEKDKK